MKIVIIVEGGIIQNILANKEDIEVVVVDYDTDIDDTNNLMTLNFDDNISDAFVEKYPIEKNIELIDYIYDKIKD